MARDNVTRRLKPQRLIDLDFTSIGANWHKAGWSVAEADVIEDVATTTILVATAHSVTANDFLIFKDGDEENEPHHAESVTTDLITLGDALSGIPSSGETFVFKSPTGTDAVEAIGGTASTTLVSCTAHGVTAKDIVIFKEGGEANETRHAETIDDANSFTLGDALTGTPSGGEAFVFVSPTTIDAYEAVSATPSTTVIEATAHGVTAKDAVMFKDGDEENLTRHAESVTANGVTLGDALTGTPSAGEEFVYKTGTVDACEDPSSTPSTTVIAAQAHSVTAKDAVIFKDGGELNETRHAESVAANALTLGDALTGTPSAGETFVYLTPDTVDACEDPSSTPSTTVIAAQAHSVTAKDFVMFKGGGEMNEPRHAESVAANALTLGDALTGTPSAGEKFVFLTPETVDACEAGTTDTIIAATAHSAAIGDLLYFVDGGESAEPRVVSSIAANTITLNAALSAAPTATEEFAFKTPSDTGTVDSGTTDTIITDGGHNVSANDIFVMTSGGEINEYRVVTAADAGTFTLNEALSGTPSADETYAVWTSTGNDVAEGALSTTNIHAVAHGAAVNDLFYTIDGGESGEFRTISAIASPNDITLSLALSGTPTAAEEFCYATPTGTDAVEAGTTDTIITATGHSVSVNDIVCMTSGDEDNEFRIVTAVDANTITLNEALTGTPTATETFAYWTPTGTDLAEEVISTTNVHAVAHAAAVNDLFWTLDGAETGEFRVVSAVPTANDFTLNAALSGTPTAAEEFATATAAGTDAVEAGTTDTIITATGHSVTVNDIFGMTSGGEVNEFRVVIAADTNTFTLSAALTGTPTATETFAYWTPTGRDLAEGAISTTNVHALAHAASVNDLFYTLDGAETGEFRVVSAVPTANDITLNEALTGAPSAAEEFGLLTPDATDACEAGTTDTIITATAHLASVNDIFVMTSGDEINEFRVVTSVAANTITLNEALTGTPTATETFAVYTPAIRHQDSAISTTNLHAGDHSVSVGDIVYMLDGGEIGEPKTVSAIPGKNDITLSAALTGTPSAGETFAYITPTSTDAVEAGTTDTIITATAHNASINDIFVMTSGGEINEYRTVIAVPTANTFTLSAALSGTPTATETFALITPTGTDLAEGGESTTKIFATAHSGAIGDIVIMVSGGENGEAQEVLSVTTDSITLSTALSGTPSAAETFNIIRPVALNKAKIIRFDSTLDTKTLIAYGSSTPTSAHDQIRSNGDTFYDLKSNNLHGGADNIDKSDNPYYIYIKDDGTAPASGELDITIIE